MTTATVRAVPRCRWRVAPPPPDNLLRAFPDLSPILLRAVARRGAADPTAARTFLQPTTLDDDPFRLAGMAEAVARLRLAIDRGEAVAVYGDYDADGVTATALLMEVLGTLGAKVRHYLPHRERDGYGVHGAALTALAAEGVRVVVTVDCGVRSAPEVAAAAERGLDIIVTDHHVLPDALPRAVAVVNPRRPDCRYGFQDLAGVGLAYKLAQALLRAAAQTGGSGSAPNEASLLDLVALGTVADVVPLVGENRTLVQRGLAEMRKARRPGLQALMAMAKVTPETVTARSLGYALGPRLNAAGRMDDADAALQLLLATDAAAAGELAQTLEARNDARREATELAMDEVQRRFGDGAVGPLLFHASPSVALGVVGLVAGRLAERFYRPALVARVAGTVARGSARSIPEFDITAALEQSADLLVRFGGHSRAAGFTVALDALPELEARLTKLAGTALSGLDLRPVLDIDAEVAPGDLTWELYDALTSLEPTGEGNPVAMLLWRSARVLSARVVGGSHLKLQLAGGPTGNAVDAIAFRHGERLAEVGPSLDLVFELLPNTWNGRTQLELKVADFGPPSVGWGG